MIQTLDGGLLAGMLIHAAASINMEKQRINELNVFPVPDGDTGTNMSLTIGTAAAELKKKPSKTVGETAAVNAAALLRGARGNSGVILSLLFRGFAKSLRDADTMDGCDLAAALDAGVETAYKAVMKPAEGNILTVSRVCARRAAEAAQQNRAVEYVLEQAIREGRTALAETVNQTPF
jgi:dihydroxyacetone kinase-like predicted kinase